MKIEKKILAAVKENDIENVSKLIKTGVNINYQDISGRTALHLACFNRNIKMIDLLLSSGANPEIKDIHKRIPVFAYYSSPWGANDSKASITEKQFEMIQYFFEKKLLDLNTPYGGETLLTKAASSFNTSRPPERLLAILNWLLLGGADPNLPASGIEYPLHKACQSRGEFEKIKILIKNGANVNVVNENGDTPFHSLLKSGFIGEGKVRKTEINKLLKSSKLLIEAGANCSIKGEYDKTVSDYAAMWKYWEILAILPYIENTALLHCDQYYGENSLKTLKLLLTKKLNINHTDKNGNTALHISSANGIRPYVELLLQSNIDISLRNNQNKTALDLATEYNRKEIINLFN